MLNEDIEIALRVLDEASAELLRESVQRTDMLKENYRRDALALNHAAGILEGFLKQQHEKQAR